VESKNLIVREFKADVDTRIITGYAAAFHNVDRAKEVIEPGAFSKTINDGMHRVKTFYNHTIPIGKPISAVQDAYGLLTESRISKTAKGDEVLELIRDGVIGEMSIMYDVIQADVNKASGVRHLRELKLYEFGPVDFACNEMAVITGVKNLADQLREGKSLDDARIAAIKEAIKGLEDLITGGDKSPAPQTLVDTAIVDGIGNLLGYVEEALKE
jgi:uncharacterized protein